MASAASTLSLQFDILSGRVSTDNNFLQSYLLSWSAQVGNVPEILPSSPKQPFWDRPDVLADKADVESRPVARLLRLGGGGQVKRQGGQAS